MITREWIEAQRAEIRRLALLHINAMTGKP